MSSSFRIRIFLFFKTNRRLIQSHSISLADLKKPESLTADSWKKLIWVAMDMKKLVGDNNKQGLNLLESKHVTLLFEKPHGRFQVAFSLACSLLGARKTSYYENYFQNQPNPADCGKILSQITDMIVIHDVNHAVLKQFSSKLTVPMFPASSTVYAYQRVISDMMTFQEKFNRLNGLTLAWIGPPTPIFNTYLSLCPLLGIKIRYHCFCIYGSGKMSPLKQHSLNDAESENLVQPCKDIEETVKGSNIIATSIHSVEKLQITLKVLKNADPGWVFVHAMPRSQVEVADEIFNHEKNLLWQASTNYLFTAMAVIVLALKEYQPKIKMPDFDRGKMDGSN